MNPAPDLARLAAIAQLEDPVLRNLLITQSYHELSLAVRAHTGGAANWCTFATWASRQAGCTIRREDLRQALHDRLGDSAELAGLARTALAHAGATREGAAITRVAMAVMRAVDADGALDRASRAVADGNLAVFAEIGLVFAQFLAASDGAAFATTLRDGDPPDGQTLLRTAFAAYHEARTADPAQREQLLHYANLLVGLHEQTRLQPQIRTALDATLDTAALRERVVAMLLPAGWRSIRRSIGVLFGRRPPLDDIVDRIAASVQRELRALITSETMTLRVADRRIRLGRDPGMSHAPSLSAITRPELAALIARIDRQPHSAHGSGARDWSVLEQRMHLIADLFRCCHEWPQLFDAPFTAEQTAALYRGGVPSGSL